MAWGSKHNISYESLGEFSFIRPKEAPVYRPSKEEFEDPLEFINRIRPEAEEYGICKIIPPPDWHPPFAVDIEQFRFTPRIQKINELEAHTRIKLNFLDQIAKFWELQGSPLKLPSVEKRILDFYTLHQLVQREGGAHSVTRGKKWGKIAMQMGLSKDNRGSATTLRSHYEKILLPYDIFLSLQDAKDGLSVEEEIEPDVEDASETIPKVSSSKCRKKLENDTANGSINDSGSDEEDPSNCRRTRIRKSCSNTPQPQPTTQSYSRRRTERDKLRTPTKQTVVMKVEETMEDPLAKYVCHTCLRGDSEEAMLLCDGCDDSYHTFCLKPPLTSIPKGDWRCPKCIAEVVAKPSDPFGFRTSKSEYSLRRFGEKADQFKSDYFNMPVHKVPSDLVEKEFWRIVSSFDEDVTVEYGADLHTVDHGSGFPTHESINEDCMNRDILDYVNSKWNLNNMPILGGSVLSHITANISGMKVPWMYVGMCFATFCWHNEDHWSYSINYLHWGESKTWYGVPGSRANDFETTMKQAAPELFSSQPDLLHQLTTIMNPNVLMEAGVPVCRTDQEAGEFVITFPRAYHAGFNQGYNFAEAVNFAPADWLKMGRECIAHYATLHRYCVFSHDELTCKMAAESEELGPRVAIATYRDMLSMVKAERDLRKSLLYLGVCDAEREAFELVPDDGRLCSFCKTTCFLSAVTCACNPTILYCLNHIKQFSCQCPPDKKILRYRYTMDDLEYLLHKIRFRVKALTEVKECITQAKPTVDN
uniref:[histone H3]-trimethyl-L-lysine(4) demethylase n=1 Tax=Lygus hesperus TaxID=30085 RepID=A0A146KQ53_LYGHE